MMQLTAGCVSGNWQAAAFRHTECLRVNAFRRWTAGVGNRRPASSLTAAAGRASPSGSLIFSFHNPWAAAPAGPQ